MRFEKLFLLDRRRIINRKNYYNVKVNVVVKILQKYH